MNPNDLYKQAGVDIDAGNEAAVRYARLARRATRPEVVGAIGGFSGGFRLDVAKYPNPVLVSGTDGVGTKLKLAFEAGIHDGVGIDCVAMCVNDILTSGAEPLFFLDYLAVHSLDVAMAEAIVGGVAAGCELAGCALVGGETAEMGDVYAPGEYDLAGTAVGVVNADQQVNGSTIAAGDVVIGLPSDGVHSNGFSLVRRLLREQGIQGTAHLPGWRGNVYEELLRPTRIYVKSVRSVMEQGWIAKGMAHITGGGLVDNIPRVLPMGTSVTLEMGKWSVPPVFEWLLANSGLSFADAARVWNMGIGYVLIAAPDQVEGFLEAFTKAGERPVVIGQVTAGEPGVVWRG